MSRELSLDSLSDDELLQRLASLIDRDRRLESDVVSHIAEVDSRKLYLDQACSSMHAYCVEVLHLSEAEAYLRITVARASRQFPVLLDMLADGRLHLSAIAKLAPHLCEENVEALLERAVHKTKREVEMLVAEVAPQPDVPSRIRKLPRTRSGAREQRPDGVGSTGSALALPPASATSSSLRPDLELPVHGTGLEPDLLRPDRVEPPVRPAVLEPVAPARYKVQFTASAALRDKLCRAQALLRHKVPDGDLAEVIDEAVTLLLGKLEARRFGKTESPRKALEDTDTSASSRHVPVAVKRAVYERDEGRCAFVDEKSGRRCSCTDPGKLEYHHVEPYAMGGDHSPDQIELRCQGHNQHQAELDFGLAKMERHRSGTSRAREAAVAYGPRASAGGQPGCGRRHARRCPVVEQAAASAVRGAT